MELSLEFLHILQDLEPNQDDSFFLLPRWLVLPVHYFLLHFLIVSRDEVVGSL